MIKNLWDELYQLENKQAKGAKLLANTRWELEDQKCSKRFLKGLEKQNLQNHAKSELYTDNNKSKHSSNSKIFKSAKKDLWKTLHQGDNFQSCYYWISQQNS